METWANEITAPAQKPREYRQVIANSVDEIYALDLADLGDVMDSNDGYRTQWAAPLLLPPLPAPKSPTINESPHPQKYFYSTYSTPHQ